MNINDIDSLKASKMKLLGIKSHYNNKYDYDYNDTQNFVSYVQVTASQNSQSNQENTNQNNSQNNIKNNNQNIQNKNISENQQSNNNIEQTINNQNNNFIQNYQNLNSELFRFDVISDNHKTGFDKDFSYNIDLTDLTQDDIQLFQNLIQKTDLAVNPYSGENQTMSISVNNESTGISYKSINISKTLFSALDEAAKTGKPIRLDFGDDTSVILKISRDGRLSADFIPNEKAMEAVLRNALPQLKAKFDAENLPYNELNYRPHNQEKNNQKEHKEKNKDE